MYLVNRDENEQVRESKKESKKPKQKADRKTLKVQDVVNRELIEGELKGNTGDLSTRSPREERNESTSRKDGKERDTPVRRGDGTTVVWLGFLISLIHLVFIIIIVLPVPIKIVFII